jgi:hypothetical protein
MHPGKLALNQTCYEIVEKTSDQHCNFRFAGKFLGEDVIWDARLITLAYYARETGKRRLQQFIEVGESCEHGRRITIALNLPGIDEPAILKTTVMIRQYKRLSSGHHAYGEFISFE